MRSWNEVMNATNVKEQFEVTHKILDKSGNLKGCKVKNTAGEEILWDLETLKNHPEIYETLKCNKDIISESFGELIKKYEITSLSKESSSNLKVNIKHVKSK